MKTFIYYHPNYISVEHPDYQTPVTLFVSSLCDTDQHFYLDYLLQKGFRAVSDITFDNLLSELPPSSLSTLGMIGLVVISMRETIVKFTERGRRPDLLGEFMNL